MRLPIEPYLRKRGLTYAQFLGLPDAERLILHAAWLRERTEPRDVLQSIWRGYRWLLAGVTLLALTAGWWR